MEITIGILDAFLTCTIISKIYSQICQTSKKERYIFYLLFLALQVIYSYFLSFINSDKLTLILHYMLNTLNPIVFYFYLRIFKKKIQFCKKYFFGIIIFTLISKYTHILFSNYIIYYGRLTCRTT